MIGAGCVTAESPKTVVDVGDATATGFATAARLAGATAAIVSERAPSPSVSTKVWARLGVARFTAGSRIASMRPSNSRLFAIGSAVAGAPCTRTAVTISSRWFA